MQAEVKHYWIMQMIGTGLLAGSEIQGMWHDKHIHYATEWITMQTRVQMGDEVQEAFTVLKAGKVASACFFAMLLGVSSAASAESPGTEETLVGDWTIISAEATVDQPRDLCFLYSPETPEGTQLRIINRSDPLVSVADAPRGSAELRYVLPIGPGVENGTISQVDIAIPGQRTWPDATAKWLVSGTLGALQLFLDPAIEGVLSPLSGGDSFNLSLEFPDGTVATYSTSLKGSAAAVDAYRACLER